MLTLSAIKAVFKANGGVVPQHRFGDEPRTPLRKDVLREKEGKKKEKKEKKKGAK